MHLLPRSHAPPRLVENVPGYWACQRTLEPGWANADAAEMSRFIPLLSLAEVNAVAEYCRPGGERTRRELHSGRGLPFPPTVAAYRVAQVGFEHQRLTHGT